MPGKWSIDFAQLFFKVVGQLTLPTAMMKGGHPFSCTLPHSPSHQSSSQLPLLRPSLATLRSNKKVFYNLTTNSSKQPLFTCQLPPHSHPQVEDLPLSHQRQPSKCTLDSVLLPFNNFIPAIHPFQFSVQPLICSFFDEQFSSL